MAKPNDDADSRIVLDHVEGLSVSRATAERCYNEVVLVNRLGVGMGYLYEQVWRVEQEALRVVPKDRCVFTFGKTAGISQDDELLVACMHEWYAVSACNFVRTVAWLLKQDEPDSPEWKEYAKAVIPAVVLWRDKVAAHPARMSPRKEDNIATLDASVMYSLAFDGARFRIASMNITKTSKGQRYDSALRPWSLTGTHEELIQRYWPKAMAGVPGSDGSEAGGRQDQQVGTTEGA